jgi:hypothetical protein
MLILANQLHWTLYSTFNHGACGVQDAAADKGYPVSDVIKAFAAVGVTCDRVQSPIVTYEYGSSELENGSTTGFWNYYGNRIQSREHFKAPANVNKTDLFLISDELGEGADL